MFKNRSKFFFALCLIQLIFGIWILIYFNYIDNLSYSQSLINGNTDLSLLIKNIYTSTWWALIVLLVNLISLFSIISFLYRDLKFQFMSIFLWFLLLILGINFKDSFLNNVSTIFIFIPIIGFNIISYYKHKRAIN